MKILGVDGGIHGGLAIVDIIDGAAPELLDCVDIPTVGTAAKERVNVLEIRDWIKTHRPDHCVIERAGSMPRQGVAGTFKYARAVGSIEATVALCGVPYTLIEPSLWKKFHGLHKAPGQTVTEIKEMSRQRALQLFPSAHALLSRRKDHGRSEAMLIALTPIHRVSAQAEKAQPEAPVSPAGQG
jgi:crossover junction endodeoxyribonuclease RuvC